MLKRIAVLAGGLMALSPAAYAWELCNETSFILKVGTAGMENGELTFEGWQRLRPGECLTSRLPGDDIRFVYAESSDAYQGGIREWNGSRELCHPDGPLLPVQVCRDEDLEDRQFFQVAQDETRTAFVEPDNFGSRAETAGLQRLLRDNGFRITSIDGYSGRQTRNALANFLNSNDINLGSSPAEKMDALEKGARSFQQEVGLTVCNLTRGDVWSAIAYRSDGTWASKGWWRVEAGDCLRPYTRSLQGQDMHLFAVLETDSETREIEAEDRDFCTSDLRFSALGREDCEMKGYETSTFRNLESTEIGMKVDLKPSDFGLKDPASLRP